MCSRLSDGQAGTVVLVGRGAKKPRTNHGASVDLHRGKPQAVAGRERILINEEQSQETTCSCITWNVDGLRALLKADSGRAALQKLLAERPGVLCLLEHKLVPMGQKQDSDEAKEELEAVAASYGYVCTWTFSSRGAWDGLVAMTPTSAPRPAEPSLHCAECTSERRLLSLELHGLHVLLVYAPNSGRRAAFRLEQWEPSIRAWIKTLHEDGRKPVLYQGDLNVAHQRTLDCWGTTAAQWGSGKASGRTEDEILAFEKLLEECKLVDGFRKLHPTEASPTCWAQKKAGEEGQREYWKRYDYCLVSKQLLHLGEGAIDAAGCAPPRLVDVRHREDAFAGGRPDHVPVESVVRYVPVGMIM